MVGVFGLVPFKAAEKIKKKKKTKRKNTYFPNQAPGELAAPKNLLSRLWASRPPPPPRPSSPCGAPAPRCARPRRRGTRRGKRGRRAKRGVGFVTWGEATCVNSTYVLNPLRDLLFSLWFYDEALAQKPDSGR